MAYTSNIPIFLTRFQRNRREALLAASIVWHAGVQQELTGTRSGRLYKIPGTSRSYRASAPGEAPARRTGSLAQSYRFQVVGDEGQIGSPKKEAVWMEKGTRRIAPRPHLRPAYDKNQAAIKQALGLRVRGF